MDILKLDYILASLIYSLLGVAVFWVAFIIIDKITPYDLWKNLVEERNQALATVVGAMCLGIAIIVASAIH
ncbi:hypothetical protein GCM10007907_07710 [Chitinimonas prasina]|uniref:DUF350 domain-containing protein n=1 Tax=Chitinimonas prasina TaxID=1434937 RepID=A0ABQ5YBQ1_9NEIS|nr:DUF350 domain-containing protein [Chitinimonas prasina]GLR11981.1 hypothetical protein GCM10007907_07710 [Chitinimonas prasina]